MITLAAMPKKPETKKVEAHLMPDKFDEFELLAKDRQWSNKKMNENIILWYLEANKKKIEELKKEK